jgi:hypothetical protein
MSKYLVTYDLKNKGIKNYDALYSAIKGTGRWWHFLDSTWIVDTMISSQQIYAQLAPHLLKDDFVLVTKIDTTERSSGWLPQAAWNWLNT